MDPAVWASIFVAIFVAIFLSITSGKHWKKARARRIADARMNARLLRLNI